ncbi:nucleotidyltransferase family protein [Pseudomonadota bacterium]|nr:nucleotidyltransferase family protein [Pseudomonadota bacterium]
MINNEQWQQGILSIDSSIEDAINNLNHSALKIILIVNESGELDGTIADGDIRRALLKGASLDSPINEIINRDALLVPAGVNRDTILQMMQVNKVYQIPIVNDMKQVIGLHLWDELEVVQKRENSMVIMAGGRGTRLQPYTEHCPKPMVHVSGKPMLEHIIDRAKIDGFYNFIISIHYLGHMIEEYFGDGKKFDVNITYIKEKDPLGTAGALSLIVDMPEHPIVVSNGDVLTDINYSEILDFHERHKGFATMAVKTHEWQHPYGVVKTDGLEITGFQEKPISKSHINAGVYVLDPDALNQLEKDAHCDMPALFKRLQDDHKRILAYPMHEPWLDVGRPIDLEQANKTTS